jgi:8-oxo-dGTP pyrophosphatase MutT (NUDIX family)
MQTITSRQVYVNPWMSVREDTIRRPDGSDGIYGVIDKPNNVVVIPLDGDRLHLVEQFRYPLGIRRWEFPQGAPPGLVSIDSRELAAMELREETGLRAGVLTDLGKLDVAPGLSSQRGRAYLATELTEGPPEREHEEQDMRTAWVERSEFEAMIRREEVTDAQSIASYALLLLHERQSGQTG